MADVGVLHIMGDADPGIHNGGAEGEAVLGTSGDGMGDSGAYYSGPMSVQELWNLVGTSSRENSPTVPIGDGCLGGSRDLLGLFAGSFQGQDLFRDEVVAVLVTHQLWFLGATDVMEDAFSFTVLDMAELSDGTGRLADVSGDARQQRMTGLVTSALGQMRSNGKPVDAGALTSSVGRLVQGVIRVFTRCSSPPPDYRPRGEAGGDTDAATLVQSICSQIGGALGTTLSGAGGVSDAEGEKRAQIEKYAQNRYRIIAAKGWTVPPDAVRVPAALLHKMKVKVVDEGLVPSIEISSDAGCLPNNMIPLFPAAAGNHVVAGLDDDGASEEYRQTVAASGALHLSKRVATLKFETPEQMAAAIERWVIAIWIVCCDLTDVVGRSSGLYDTGKTATAGSSVVVYCPREEVEQWATKVKDLAHMCSRRNVSVEQNMGYFRMLVGTSMRTITRRHNVEGSGRLTLGAALHASREELGALIAGAQAAMVLPYEDTYLDGAPCLGVASSARASAHVPVPGMTQQGAPQPPVGYVTTPYGGGLWGAQPRQKAKKGGAQQVCHSMSTTARRVTRACDMLW